MRPRVLVVSFGLATSLVACALLSGCKEKPAATIKEVNRLDEKSAEAPKPVEDPRFKEFFDRVRAYTKIHSTADSRVPSLKETSDPKQISGREKALANEIRVERAGAKQGDVFSPSAAREIGTVVAEDFNSRPVRDQKAILVEVPMKLPPAINTDYPTTLPLATVPPSLLLKLPTLPEDLEYRFLGRHLILRDIKANLIVDFIPDVVPAAPARTAGREAHP
ncbi:MAG TPA: hypothetical protein VFI56_10000 [Vicinamibacterales bacterium]|nr:hypothetical protein [Vicinamibacterales bacterium]